MVPIIALQILIQVEIGHGQLPSTSTCNYAKDLWRYVPAEDSSKRKHTANIIGRVRSLVIRPVNTCHIKHPATVVAKRGCEFPRTELDQLQVVRTATENTAQETSCITIFRNTIVFKGELLKGDREE